MNVGQRRQHPHRSRTAAPRIPTTTTTTTTPSPPTAPKKPTTSLRKSIAMALLLAKLNRNALGGSAMLLLNRPGTCHRLRHRRPAWPMPIAGRSMSSAAVLLESIDTIHDNDTDTRASASLSMLESVLPSSGNNNGTTPQQQSLLDPKELCPVLQPPTALSPSSIAELLACPQSFLFQYLYGLKQPTSLALLKGRLCHSALEQLYDLSPIDRNVTNLHNLFRKNYKEIRGEHLYLFRNEESSEAEAGAAINEERTWGLQALQLLTNYMNTEDAKSIQPAKREVWVSARLPIRARRDGDVDYDIDAVDDSSAAMDKNQTFLVRGIVDRLDLARGYDSRSHRVDELNADGFMDAELEDFDRVDPTVLGIVDYKTSQRPNLKYSPAMNRKIYDQSFFQLQIYALLLHERQLAKQQELRLGRRQNQLAGDGNEAAEVDDENASEKPFYLPVRFLKLLYLKSDHNRHADSWTLDLGSTPRIRKQTLDATRRKLQDVYGDVMALVNAQDPKAFVGCTRSFCYCHVCRPRFVPGTVWEPPSST